MNPNPLVSIVIPVYNGSNYLREAVESALAQTYRNIEILVVNDGSRDDGKTREVALTFGNRIRYLEKSNGGVSSALNLGIREMHGAYFSWLSHDDLYPPDKIEKQIVFLYEHNAFDDIIFTGSDYIDSEGRFLYTSPRLSIDESRFFYQLVKDRFIGGCTLLIPRVAFERCGFFDEALKTVQDYDMWFRMIRAGFKFRYLPIAAVKTRLHPLQDTVVKRPVQIAEETAMFLNVLATTSPQSLWGSDDFMPYGELARLYYRQGMTRVAWFALKKGSRLAGNAKWRLIWSTPLFLLWFHARKCLKFFVKTCCPCLLPKQIHGGCHAN